MQTNLADCLRHKADTLKHEPIVPVAKSSTFKRRYAPPRSESSRRSSPKKVFATSGFGKQRPPALTGSTSHSVEPIDLSLDSPPSSGIKRSSSDLFPSSPPKRIKTVERYKENIFDSPSRPPSPRKQTYPPLSPRRRVRGAPESGDFAPSPSWKTQFPDLLNKSLEELKALLAWNFDAEKNNNNLLALACSAPESSDRLVLNTIRDIYRHRIAALQEAEAETRKSLNRGSLPLHTSTPPSVSVRSAISITSSVGTSFNDYSSASNHISRTNPILFTDNNDSDDEGLWASFDDVPMEDLPGNSQDEVEIVSFSPTPPKYVTASLVAATTDSSDSNLRNTPFYSEVVSQLKDVFGLTSFRKNQLEAMTATLQGRDTFVLMPTGGGKSLCYQLPAVCSKGSTKGVTIVVSPLRALMEDQVMSLREKNVDVILCLENADGNARQQLSSRHKPSIMYITPEKLKESGSIRNSLAMLYKEDQLARFVVDEAHCISTWGQDFREAFKCLGMLRAEYPKVPIIALTATANSRTVADIKSQLQLRDCMQFTQSFNRPNLRYKILPKTGKKKVVEEISDYIYKCHPRKTGIIYCTGRDRSEDVAKSLREKGHKATHYHAKMDESEKNLTLRDWKSSRCLIIVATIAFGMGIDKADVRFVIHHDISKSLDGYYQETGRAGRDGLPADCVLFYSYQDCKTIEKMIKEPRNVDLRQTHEERSAAIQRQLQTLHEVVEYCENKSTCRRVQLLQYFDENFDPKDCHAGCDNCGNTTPFQQSDVTREAQDVLALVKGLVHGSSNITIQQCRAIFKGSDTKWIRDRGYQETSRFGAGKHMAMELVEQLFKSLLLKNVLATEDVLNAKGFHNSYLRLGPEASHFLRGDQRWKIEWRPKTTKVSKSSRKDSSAQSNRAGPSSSNPPIIDDPIGFYRDDSDNEPIECFDSPKRPSKAPAPSHSSHQGGQSGDPCVKLNGDLRQLRQQILKRDSTSDVISVWNDETLGLLSTMQPTNDKEFRTILQEYGADNHQFDQYGHEFLKICQTFHRSTDSKSVWSTSQLHAAFEYSPRPSTPITTPAASTSKGKFRPAK